nr:hypothetical protein BaRGS_033387 [Batillaria attramentaria]
MPSELFKENEKGELDAFIISRKHGLIACEALCTCLGVQNLDEAVKRCLCSGGLSSLEEPWTIPRDLEKQLKDWWSAVAASDEADDGQAYEELVALFDKDGTGAVKAAVAYLAERSLDKKGKLHVILDDAAAGGLPVKVVEKDDDDDAIRSMALSKENKVIVTDSTSATGLERRIVIVIGKVTVDSTLRLYGISRCSSQLMLDKGDDWYQKIRYTGKNAE